MDGHKYEYQCAEILKKHGFSKIKVTKGSGDQGIDVVAERNGKKYGIQCKYYSSPVGNHAVQEVFAGTSYYNCDIAVVMTNTTFTKSAKELAERTGVLLWENSKVPFSVSFSSGFKLTKYIGIFSFSVGVIGILTMCGMSNIYHPILQTLEIIFMIVGGFFSIFEHEQWAMPFISSIMYLISGSLSLIYSIFSNTNAFGIVIFSIFAIMSFIRADYLHIKTNGMHIWDFNSIKKKKEINTLEKAKKVLNNYENKIN